MHPTFLKMGMQFWFKRQLRISICHIVGFKQGPLPSSLLAMIFQCLKKLYSGKARGTFTQNVSL